MISNGGDVAIEAPRAIIAPSPLAGEGMTVA
jgi:hypothetical protein